MKHFQRPLKRWYQKQFAINLEEAVDSNIDAYSHLNDFFTRALKPEARPIDSTANAIVSPVDGTISQAGMIEKNTILQAKNHNYELQTLLGDHHASRRFHNGHFVTIYLSPSDYHRIHMPVDGVLTDMIHVPGRLFSVSPFSVNNIKKLFARNERVVCLFDTSMGKMALILVGAINVAAIETVWAGLVTPPRGKRIVASQYDHSVSLKRGEEMGRFNMGSTVILLTEANKSEWLDEKINPQQSVKMGQKIGLSTPSTPDQQEN